MTRIRTRLTLICEVKDDESTDEAIERVREMWDDEFQSEDVLVEIDAID
jgi:hypothetical protein